MSSSNTPNPCPACKYLRRKCTQECIFKPHFPAEKPQLFTCVHRIYGASNVGKLLKELSDAQREDAVKSLAYEAEARIRDPVYGCVGSVYVLQQRLKQVHTDLHGAWKELSPYLSPQVMQALQAMLANPNTMKAMLATQFKPNQFQANADFPPNGNINVVASPLVAAPHNQMMMAEQQELLEAQQLAAAQQQRELMMSCYEQQQQQEFMRLGGFERVCGGGRGGGLNQMGDGGGGPASLALGNFDNVSFDQIQQQQQGEQQHHHPHTHVPYSNPHAIEAQQLLSAQQHHDKQGLEDLLGGGGDGPARLALGNFDNVSLYQIQQQQQGEPHNQLVIQDTQQQELLEAQQLAAAAAGAYAKVRRI